MKRILRIIKNNKFYIAGFFVLVVVLVSNAFPRGYVFSGGDTSQFIEMKNGLRNLFFNWQGRVIFYYSIFYFLDILNVSNSAQLSWYLGIMIVGAYISFGVFSILIFKSHDRTRTLTSLFYSLNIYTLFLFSGNLGFSYYPSLYIFIPVLAGFFIKFITTEKNIYGAWFVLTIFLASSGFGNVAFALSFSIFLAIIFLAFVVVGIIKIKKSLLRKLIVLGILAVLISAFWLLPIIPQIKSGIEKLQNSNVLEFHYVIRNTASPLLNTLSLINFSGDHFPYNFPYENLSFLKSIIIALSFLPIILVSLGLFYLRTFTHGYKKYFLAFWIILIILALLVARVVEPFKIINHYIFSIWGMETLRGFDKTAIYIPLILTSLMLMVLHQLKNKRWWTVIMIMILLLPLPFYLGKIQQNLSYRFAGASPQNKDFRKSKLSFLVKIPEEYYMITKEINNDNSKSFIMTLPYTSSDGSGISYFPKWKMYGTDITRFLYDKTMLVANDSLFSNWNPAKKFNDEADINDGWLIKLLGAMNVKYIIYHKDAPDDSVSNSQEKIKKLERDGLLKNLNDNDYLTLYEIKEDYIIPYISWQSGDIPITSDTTRISGELDKIKTNLKTLSFKEINPKKIEVKIDNNNLSGGDILILAEKFDPNWKAYFILNDGREIEIKNHILARGYANGWQINQPAIAANNLDYILIEFYPVRLMRIGCWISFATTLFILVYLIVYYYGSKKNYRDSKA